MVLTKAEQVFHARLDAQAKEISNMRRAGLSDKNIQDQMGLSDKRWEYLIRVYYT